MKTVYVVNKGAHDYSAAEEFGALAYCTDGIVPKYNINYMVRIFEDSFKDSNPEDYILITSLTTLCSIACSIFACKHGRLNLLIFKDGRYIERKVLLNTNKE